MKRLSSDPSMHVRVANKDIHSHVLHSLTVKRGSSLTVSALVEEKERQTNCSSSALRRNDDGS